MSKRPRFRQETKQVPSKSDAMRIFNQATHLKQAGKHEEALSTASQLPLSPTRSRLMVEILLSSGTDANLKKAQKAASHWLKRQRSNAEPVQRLIEIQLLRGEFMQALHSCNELAKRLPGKGTADYFRAVAVQLQGNPEKAVRLYSRFVKAENVPKNDGSKTSAAAQKVRAALLLCSTAIGQFPGSRKSDQHLLLDRPDELQLLKNSLLAWEQSGAEEQRDPPHWEQSQAAEGWHKLGGTLTSAYSGAVEAVVCLDHALRLNPDHEKARASRLFALNYHGGKDESEIFAAHRSTGAWLEEKHGGIGSMDGGTNRKESGTESRRIRIAYLSSDLFTHSVAYFLAPVVFRHDKSRFAVHLIHTGKKNDRVTEWFRSEVEYFHSAAELDNPQLHELIVQQRIDMLVELNGFTGNNRLPVLAARAAPIQVTWLGYPNTTGLSNMDYRIVDAITDPVEYARTLATEELVHMPGTFSVYDPLFRAPPVSDLPSLETGEITFGCFNSLFKINDDTVAAWSRILREVPNSRLLIKCNGLTYPEQRRLLTEAFNTNGIDSNRLSLMGMVSDMAEHLTYYNQVDVALDCFPYNGTTTNCESMLMGVPVVTLAGTGHRSRVTASQLHAVGLEELIAGSWDEYVQIAVKLALDRSKLKRLRKRLRNTLLNSPLCDAAAFTRELEARYIEWHRKGN